MGALIRIAALDVQRGDVAAARASYEQTGLSDQQCALVDASPALTRSNVGSNDFPEEAWEWGPVIAYPRFIFGSAASDILKDAVFTQSYRPNGGLGCGGQQQKVRFSLPDR